MEIIMTYGQHYRPCYYDKDGKARCLEMCSDFTKADSITKEIRKNHNAIKTTLVPCNPLLPVFFDKFCGEYMANKVSNK